ncbi:hypothetical protein RJ640_021109 [Escallonia rubra]|uniref:Myb/SANT-like domain-containing protein n=1 Tax=Escallonia rubra TaxID=112253 RepID=A0AA88R1X2_9ASTE|nr:hypothetical protein RJ640_021109 [Escallonia rubra]
MVMGVVEADGGGGGTGLRNYKRKIFHIKGENKPGTHFNRDGWANLVGELNAMTGREYDKLQLKNHWDALRRDWQQWHNLMHRKSGLG